MGLIRRSPTDRVAAEPLEEAAELKETTTRRGRSVAAKMFFRGKLNPLNESTAIQRIRASANPEDDGAETELLNDERRNDEGY